MRVDEVVANNKKLLKKFDLSKDLGRELATISVLTDISETLALMLDMYAHIYGRVIGTKEQKNDTES